jgi:hypothetical protein
MIFVVLCVAFGGIMILIESSSLYDIHGFNFTDVKSIKIYDRGLYGNDTIEITDNKKIQQIGRFINTSIGVRQSDFPLAANRGFCDLDIITKNNKITSIDVVKTNDKDGFINSGQWRYKSDSLLSFILTELRNKPQ